MESKNSKYILYEKKDGCWIPYARGVNFEEARFFIDRMDCGVLLEAEEAKEIVSPCSLGKRVGESILWELVNGLDHHRKEVHDFSWEYLLRIFAWIVMKSAGYNLVLEELEKAGFLIPRELEVLKKIMREVRNSL